VLRDLGPKGLGDGIPSPEKEKKLSQADTQRAAKGRRKAIGSRKGRAEAQREKRHFFCRPNMEFQEEWGARRIG